MFRDELIKLKMESLQAKKKAEEEKHKAEQLEKERLWREAEKEFPRFLKEVKAICKQAVVSDPNVHSFQVYQTNPDDPSGMHILQMLMDWATKNKIQYSCERDRIKYSDEDSGTEYMSLRFNV